MNDSGDRNVRGFRFAAASCGLKPDGALDVGLLCADEPVATAAVFTTNRVQAAPVQRAAARLERGRAQAVLVNSGNANACTGREGLEAVDATTAAVAEQLGCDREQVLPASTGVIGEPLPATCIEDAAPGLVQSLSEDGVDEFARAILTTDQGPKVHSARVDLESGEQGIVLGVAKGAGMIHPHMATTLGFVVTDIPTHSSFLARALRTAADRTFNCITVDGDTSTNDAIFALTSGRVPTEPLRSSDRDGRAFIDALSSVLDALGHMIVADGEGAEHVARVEVSGAPSEAAARLVAERIARSTLVKTALHGCDPNWGRILMAAGNAGVAFDSNNVSLYFDEVSLVHHGRPQGPEAEAQAREVMEKERYTIHVVLGDGHAHAHYVTCDLGHEYVRINASYRT